MLDTNPTNRLKRQLLLVAGPSRVGKSTLMKSIAEGKMTSQFESLGLDNIPGWEQVSANVLFDNSACRPTCLILHYDLYAQFHLISRQDFLRGLLAQYEEVYALTLCTHHKQLKSRAVRRLVEIFRRRSPFNKYSKVPKLIRIRLKKFFFYSKLLNIEGLYQQYFDILSEHPNVRANWIMDTSKQDSDIMQPMEQALFLALLVHGTSPESSTGK